ncbi:hypothetical protein K435DRAFT_729596 [Dendrothele bispora CBS 962.96]|uniref:Uncharacterized protein n=1 Tax=Dendrothele bispora (strain CBS 962.96) TaxID=1314807 RepID=A0A4S8LIB1_DENBC|nr:hypothetical protein K435DRAFT_729596 [Dendrothele bispora CBS 962.96]
MQALYEESEETSEDDPGNSNVVELMRQLGIDVDSPGEDPVLPTVDIDNNQDYSPYPNKLMMLLDIMDNLPRLRLSTAHFKLILWLLNQAGVRNVPKYDTFRQVQRQLSQTCSTEPKECTSSLGNHFYINDPREAIQRQFANPQVVPHMNFYPEETDGPISEVWQAERWKEFDPSDLTPMYSKNGKQFYIDEVAMLQDGRVAIPRIWIKRRGTLHADCNMVEIAPDGTWSVRTEIESIQADQFESNYLEIVESMPDAIIPWNDPALVSVMPNPKRALVGKDEDLYVVMVPMWADDVSGNKSKQYNKHINLYTQNSNLPARLLQQEYFVNFVSTSPHASSSEQFAEIRKIVNDTQNNPIKCYNAHTRRTCGVILRVPSLPADNPQQSEEASHMGGGSNQFCRRCNVGGTHKEKESDSGYHALFQTGVLRSAAETKINLNEQLRTAMLGGDEKRVAALQTATGTKDKVTEYWIDILRNRANEILEAHPTTPKNELVTELSTWLNKQPGDKMNPLLDIAGLDPNRDTPIEILHTILLGIVKYTWLMFHSKLSNDSQRHLFVSRLQSTDTNGLTIPPLRAAYMMQYRNGLIGKHFKALMQTMVFHVHDLVTPAEFEVIKAVGELGAMLWVPEINDMNQYTKDLEVRIGNVLDAFAAVDPNKITVKIKLHLLSHLTSDCRRYGPAIHNSTEIFECFNAVFRMCSILSNHQAPSRDISRKIASMDRLKHMLSGGYWYQDGEWVQASPRVRRILQVDTVLQQHLGWVPPVKVHFGKVTPLSEKKVVSLGWEKTQAFSIHPQVRATDWVENKSVIAQSGDICTKGSWIAIRQSNLNTFIIGRLTEILSPTVVVDGDPDYILTVETFILGENRHPDFDMPVLRRPAVHENTPSLMTVEITDILFRVSVQHDCRLNHCQLTGKKAVRQERKETSQHVAVLAHVNDDNFIINTHALHNATLLRQLLPRALTEPRPLRENRQAYHLEVSKKYQDDQEKKRKATSEKRKATAERNRQAKIARGAEMGKGRESLRAEETVETSRPNRKRVRIDDDVG